MSTITLPYDINNGDILDADKVMSDLEAITTEYNSAVGGEVGDVLTTANTKTVSNKTLTSPTINTPTIATPTITNGTSAGLVLTTATLTKPTINGSVQAVTADSDGATVTFNLAASNVHTVTLGGNRTLAISNATAGQYFAIELVQDGTGSRTVTWFTTIKWVGNTAPTLTTTANKKDTFMFRVTGSGTYDGYIVGMNI